MGTLWSASSGRWRRWRDPGPFRRPGLAGDRHTDMRKGFPGLSLQVQEVLRRDPLSGHLFCFRGRRGDLLKVIWHDGPGRVPIREEAGARALSLAFARGRRGVDNDSGRWPICWKGSTGAIPSELGVRLRSADSIVPGTVSVLGVARGAGYDSILSCQASPIFPPASPPRMR